MMNEKRERMQDGTFEVGEKYFRITLIKCPSHYNGLNLETFGFKQSV